MTTKELMIGDIIGVTHEELGLVYAKVEYINETGDLMVRACQMLYECAFPTKEE